jgi:hypothetical protein
MCCRDRSQIARLRVKRERTAESGLSQNVTASPGTFSLTYSLLRSRPGVCADLGRDRCFQGSHVLTPPSSPTSYQTLFGVVHTGYLTGDSAVLRVRIPKSVPWRVFVKSLICKEKMLDPILCCAILQILRARGETPAFARRLVG